ncbi:MAG: glycosyltransferase family 1 protein [Cyclobacteriaceae bacterium]
MRIGFDAKRLFNNYTGLGNYSRFVVEALIRYAADHEYVLFTPKVQHNDDTKIFHESENTTIVEPSKLISKLGLRSFWRSVKLGEVAKKNGVQILHGLSNELPKTKPSGLKTVITVHDLIFKRYPSFYKPIDVKIYDYKLRKALETADAVVAISKQTTSDISTYYGYPENKIDVIYQGCHPSFHRRYDADVLQQVRAKYQLPAKYLLNVGTLEDRKNALVIVQALREVDPSISAVFIGRETAYADKIKHFAKAHKLESRVNFIHKVDFKDLPAIYQQAELFAYPSLFEGFGIPIVEAIASGTPVIAARTSSLTEAGGPGTIYFDPENSSELARLTNDLLSNRTRREEIIVSSNQYITQFEPQRIAVDMMKVYNRVT